MTDETPPAPRIAIVELERYALAALDAETSEAPAGTLGHASLRGVDAPGYRSLPPYFMGCPICGSNRFMRLHDGAARFHGTNPIAVAAPAGQDDPRPFDGTTSAIPFNSIRFRRSFGIPLAPASGGEG